MMQLAGTSTRQIYRKQVKELEARITESTRVSVDHEKLAVIQKLLDKLAERYQNNDQIGTDIYKLYELQALIYYFQGKDSEALDFINYAIEVRGASYQRAEKLKAQLSRSAEAAPNHNPEKAKENKLVGLTGWLALFTVGVAIAIVYNAVQLFSYPSTFQDIASVQDKVPGFVSAVTPVLWFEVFQFVALVVMGIALLVLLAKGKRMAKGLAVMYMLATVALGIIDYAWASAVFHQFSLNLDKELSSESAAIGRAIVSSVIWIPYFLISKRVKATLTH